MKSNLTAVLLLVFTNTLLFSQSDRNAPGLAATTLERGEIELILNNSLNLDGRIFNNQSKPYRFTDEEYFGYAGLLQATVGVDRAKNFNVGLDLVYNQIVVQESTQVSSVLGGPRIRWRPFGDFDRTFGVTMQNYVRFQFAGSDTSLAASLPMYWGNDLILTKLFSSDALRAHYILIAQLSFNLNPRSGFEGVDQKSPITTPITLLAGIFPQRNLLFFLGLNAQPEFGTVPWAGTDDYFRRKTALNALGGFQVSFYNNLFLFVTYSNALVKKGDVFGQSVNLGVRLTMGEYGYY